MSPRSVGSPKASCPTPSDLSLDQLQRCVRPLAAEITKSNSKSHHSQLLLKLAHSTARPIMARTKADEIKRRRRMAEEPRAEEAKAEAPQAEEAKAEEAPAAGT